MENNQQKLKNKRKEKLQGIFCPKCYSEKIICNGHKNGKQQYKCKECNNNFIITTGTPFHGIHDRDKILRFTMSLVLGLTVRKAAQYSGISVTTYLKWKHKFIPLFNNSDEFNEIQSQLSDVSYTDSQYIMTCPLCSSVAICKNGNKNGKQQYRCNDCKKSFIATTGRPIHYIHDRKKFKKYAETIVKGLSIRAAAEYTGISKNTSFKWRKLINSEIERYLSILEPMIESASHTLV